jgi:hypothetical protein
MKTPKELIAKAIAWFDSKGITAYEGAYGKVIIIIGEDIMTNEIHIEISENEVSQRASEYDFEIQNNLN